MKNFEEIQPTQIGDTQFTQYAPPETDESIVNPTNSNGGPPSVNNPNRSQTTEMWEAEDSIVITQELPVWGLSSQGAFNNPDQNEIDSSLTGSLNKIRFFWKEREEIYRLSKDNVGVFKKREKELFNGKKKIHSLIQAYIDGLATSGNQIEVLMSRSIKFGKSIKNFVIDNLDKLFTEESLEDKIKSISESDPDERERKMMKEVQNYYQKLEKLFVIYINSSDIENTFKRIRPDYISNYYFNIETKLNELMDENRETKAEDVPKFRYHVRKFFETEYFHNAHYFISLLYKE